MLERLKHETYLDYNGLTRKSIVDKLAAFEFEREKKGIDINNSPASTFWIPGLRSDSSRGLKGPSAKRFDENRMYFDEWVSRSKSLLSDRRLSRMSREDFRVIFEPLVERVVSTSKSLAISIS